MKLKNIKVGMILEYKGGDPYEIDFKEGDLVKVVEIDDDKDIEDAVSVECAKGRCIESSFNARYLKKTGALINAVAGYRMQEGHINPEAELAAKLVILPATNDFLKAANRIINRWVDGEISFSEVYSMWSALLFHGGVSMSEYEKRTKIILQHGIDKELL